MNTINKKAVIGLVFLFFWGYNIFSLELWQGFSDDMSIEDIINRSTHLFGNGIEIRRETNRNNMDEIHTELQEAISYILPRPDLKISIVAIARSENSNNFPELDYLSFFFFESKLIYIYVKYKARSSELLPVLTRQFGNPTAFQYTAFSFNITVQAYRWRNQGRDIFLNNWDGRITYINPNVNIEYRRRIAEENRRLLEAEAEEQERRRRTLDNIQL